MRPSGEFHRMGGYVHLGFIEQVCNFSSCATTPVHAEDTQGHWILASASNVVCWSSG